MIENGQEVPLPVAYSVVNITDIAKVTRSSRVFSLVFPKEAEDVSASKKATIPVANPVSTLVCQSGVPSAPMRYSGIFVKAFDGSRKTVIGEMDLPMKIGPSDFQITFQVMDIHPVYSFLLGRPWIHEAGAVTSTIHQKLKFVKNNKLVVVGREKTLLVSHLSSFAYVDVEEEVGTLL
ncbi:hypothetical protein KIW84_022506 [Lathyrus oleraceus]|uniref:Uncharacterized protein n=1 Tax=Pisum sativum TaxID=3888 RepID=A0A9D4YCP0_PEA|nr:hypothetical protein KIW84_022506 [Pisum sativum]